MSSDKQHIRHCILFAFQLKKSALEANEMICSALGENAVAYSTCKKWYQRFRNDNFDLSDQERPGKPKKVEDEELDRLLQENPCQTQTELAEQLGITQQAVSNRLQKLGRIQKVGYWVPHVLSQENKARRYDTALALLSRFKRKDFLYKIVTGDEKWVMYDNPKRRKSWVYPGEPSTSTAKPNIHDKKVLLCIWWDMKGVLYYELLKPGETINSERYQEQLMRLSYAIEEKRPYTGSGTRHVILLQDNARPHTAKATKELLWSLGWEILPHAAYSPDLAPSDYYLFRSLQHYLTDSKFKTYEDVNNSIADFIRSKPPSFFREGIRQLPEKWNKCITSNGDYFEN